ncbi:hypothetical protein P0L94_07860 [Microbacter sp. GSS18]|nr:hypothetical protein P0L94_07860 [Microbacter sp. GSS18]
MRSRRLRSILVGTLLGVALGFAVQFPATAAESGWAPSASAAVQAAAGTAAPRAAAAAVTGEPWSAPAYPVDCRSAGGQITCTPTAASDITAQTCFLNVLVNGERSTVCTTFEDHEATIQGDGGTPVIVEYGCSLGDVVCVTFENAGRGMAFATTAMMFAVADNMRFDTGSLLWDAAVTEWSFWQWAILMVLFGSMVWAVAAAIVSGDRDELVGALVRSFIAVPAVPISLWLTGHLLNTVDDMTWYILNRDGPASLFSTLQSVMWAGGQANYFFAFIIHGMLWLGMLLLMLVFTFRNIVLAALIAVGPVAWMIFPVRGIGPQWVVRYVSAVVVLLLTGPLTIGFVTLIINGLSTVTTIWDPQSWPLLVGLVLVAFAPFAVFGLFSFVGAAAADSVGSAVGSRTGRMGGAAARSVVSIPTRVGSSPAGIPRGASAASAGGRGTGPTGRSGGSPGAPAPSRPPGGTGTGGPAGAATPSTAGSGTPRGGSGTPHGGSAGAPPTTAPAAGSTGAGSRPTPARPAPGGGAPPPPSPNSSPTGRGR